MIVSLVFFCQPCCIQGLQKLDFFFFPISLPCLFSLVLSIFILFYWLTDLTPPEWLGERWLFYPSPLIHVSTVRYYISPRLFGLLIQVKYMFTQHTKPHTHTFKHFTLWIELCKESILCAIVCVSKTVLRVSVWVFCFLRGVFHHLALKRMKHAHAFSAAYTHCHPHNYAEYTSCDTYTHICTPRQTQTQSPRCSHHVPGLWWRAEK